MLLGTLGFILAICALALAASCVSPEELRRQDEATGAGYGFHPGTDAFATCLQRESLARRYSVPAPPPDRGWGYWASPGGRIALARGSDPTPSLIRISSALTPSTSARRPAAGFHSALRYLIPRCETS
jgi:hypothetical protein